MTIKLRDYQEQALMDAIEAFVRGVRKPLIVVPTGGGKSPIQAEFIRSTLRQWPDQRILSLVHVKELVRQNLNALLRIWPQAPVSVCCAGLKMKNTRGQIVFASIDSIYKKGFELGQVDIIIIDEAHLVPPSGEGKYRKLLKDLAMANQVEDIPVLGLTATPYRMTTGSLVEGRGKIFDEISHEVDIVSLITDGYLVPLISKGMVTNLDTSGVAKRGGEFIESQLQAAVDREELTKAACREIVQWGKDRKSWLVFSTGVAHAHHICDELRALGIVTEVVHGAMPISSRDSIIGRYKRGVIQALVNDSVLTTGFDHPPLDLLAVLRPTMSPGLWVQMLGRGTRISPETGKTNCLVLDFGGNTFRHGPIDQIKGKVKGDKQAPPMKQCPSCQSLILAGLNICPDCGHDFEIERQRQKHAAIAAEAPLISNSRPEQTVSDWLPVTKVVYRRHQKPDSFPTLRVEYQCGYTSYSEWVCLCHPDGTFPRRKAEQWWSSRGGEAFGYAPDNVDEALHLAESLDRPTHIRVAPDGRFWRIVSFRWPDQQAAA